MSTIRVVSFNELLTFNDYRSSAYSDIFLFELIEDKLKL